MEGGKESVHLQEHIPLFHNFSSCSVYLGYLCLIINTLDLENVSDFTSRTSLLSTNVKLNLYTMKHTQYAQKFCCYSIAWAELWELIKRWSNFKAQMCE